MDEEIICTDGKFPPDFIEFYAQYGVVTPSEGTLYSVREVIRHGMGVNAGQLGLLLNELKNPPVPIEVQPLGKTKREPTWSIKRFSHLDGSALTAEEVKEWDRVQYLTKSLNF